MADEQTTQLALADQQGALEVQQQVNQLQYLMRQVLKDGEHFGIVPGTRGGKPTLYQSGAEKIAFMFKLVPRYRVEKISLGGGHREVEVTCTLYQRGSDVVEGEGIGSCSTMESKYRYRKQWEGGQSRRVENPDIADTYNTVLKMAKKRALVDAVKSTTAASDIFTQDVEDLPAYMYSQPARPARGAGATTAMEAPMEDLDWLRETTATIVALGYQEGEVKGYLWAEYKRGGKPAAQEAAHGLIAAAGKTDAEAEQAAGAGDTGAEAIEADTYEQDVEF